MRYYSPDPSDSSTGTTDSSRVPSVMDNDPGADEQVINQQAGEQYPKDVETPADTPARIAPDELADSIAYAIDGSGPGPTNDKPNVSGHKTVSEGITGAGPDEEEDALRD